MMTESKITHLFCCRLCIAEVPLDIPLKQYQSVEMGMTEKGFQLWCKRHACNIVNIELNGSSWTWDDSTNLGIRHSASEHQRFATAEVQSR
jgi:hypothetical protein